MDTKTMRSKGLSVLAGLAGVLAVGFWAGETLHAMPLAPQRREQPPADAREDQIDLRPKFVPGQVSRFELLINSRSELKSADLPELEQRQAMKQTLRLSLRVLETDTDGATLEMVYDSAKVTFESEEMSAEYDSAHPTTTKSKPGAPQPVDPLDMADPSKLLESLVKGMVGSKLTLKTDAAGNIISVTGDGGVSGMSKSFMNSVGGGLPGVGGGIPSSGQTAQWAITGSRPSGLVRIGQSWTNEDGLAGTPLGEFKMKTTHTLESHRGNLAGVKFSGKAEAASAGTPSPTGFQLQYMTNDGRYEWDTRRGGLERMDADMRVGVEATLTGATMKHDTTTTVSVRRLDGPAGSPPPRR